MSELLTEEEHTAWCSADCCDEDCPAQPMSDDEIVAAQRRSSAATIGAWGVDAPYNRRALVIFACHAPGDPSGSSQPSIAEVKDRHDWNANADFIAHARTDVGRLVATIRARENALNIALSGLRRKDEQIAALTAERDAWERLYRARAKLCIDSPAEAWRAYDEAVRAAEAVGLEIPE